MTIIANPKAGSTQIDFVSAVQDACSTHCESVEVLWTKKPGHAAELARQCVPAGDSGRPDAIVSIGGDGTLREVVTGLIDAGSSDIPPLLVLPGGTGNSNYRHLWDDLPWQQTVAAALTGAGGECRTLDLARILNPSRLVVLGTSTGLFAEATAEALTVPVAGRARYQQAIASVMARYIPYAGRVVVDGTVVHDGKTVLVNVGGGRHRAGVFDVLPRSVPDDGLLDVCVIGADMPVTEALQRMRNGTHLESEAVHYARGRSITVERTDGAPLRFEHDGEVVPADTQAFTIEVVPAALPVFAAHRRWEDTP
ncbi:diacylglycerol/lipid kinase family protein [Streptomyces sp. NPDC059008]|uniref:diacylglycerol/lipid kinase family protein n=1 Tax=Streptomyces sp. NPDC059008 TaxID=3346693 RepID=UPI0036B622F2